MVMEDFAQNNVGTSKNNSVKNVEFGIGGILLGLVFVATVLFTLNYFNILNLPFNLPHQKIISRQPASTYSRNNTIILAGSKKVSPTLEAKAEKAGYKIIWQGNENDTTGSTILASKERVKDIGFQDQFGYLNHQTVAIGEFKNLEKIAYNKDYYLTLNDPIKHEEIKLRISPEVYAPDASSVIFVVDNLNKAKATGSFSIEKLFDFSGSENNLKKIKTIINQGDIIYAGLHITLIGDKTGITREDIKKDKNGYIYIDSITLRRFGGKKQVDKELSL